MKPPFDTYDDMPGMESAMSVMSAMFEDMLHRQNNNGIAPDTAGVDYFFIEGFVNFDMGWEFEAIEQEVIKHCYDKFEEFADVSTIGNTSGRINAPSRAMEKKITKLLYNGFKLGDQYCTELLKNLYKSFYRKEYNQLKRFRKITSRELFGFVEDAIVDNGAPVVELGRIMGMCTVFGIEFSDDVSVLYRMLDKMRIDWEAQDEEESIIAESNNQLFEECLDEIEKILRNTDEREKNRVKRKTHRYNKFIGECLRTEGYPVDYVERANSYEADIIYSMAKSLEILKTLHPNKEYTLEEIMFHMHLYKLTTTATSINDFYDDQMDIVFRDLEPFVDEEKGSLFNPNKIVVNEQKKEIKMKPVLNIAPVSMGEAKEEDYLAEIAELRNKLNSKEQTIKNLSDMYRSAKQAQKEAEALRDKESSDREELYALREYAYKSTIEDEPTEEITIDEMKKVIKDKKIVIIGGHVNWINKLKKEFPDWLFVMPENFKKVDASMLEDKEMIYFYTDYISHTAYGKFISALRENKLRFGYLGSLNLNNVVSRIYKDTVE